MSDFVDIRLPPEISYGAVGGSGWPTRRTMTESGFEAVELLTAQPLGQWTVSRDAMLEAEHRRFNAFWMVVRARGFRFKDWTDFTISATESRFVEVDSGVWQLAKHYEFGGEGFDRYIYKVVDGTFTPTGGTGAFDVDSGRWTGASAPTSCTCEFDVPVRFDVDEKNARAFNRNAGQGLLIAWENIPLREVRVRIGEYA